MFKNDFKKILVLCLSIFYLSFIFIKPFSVRAEVNNNITTLQDAITQVATQTENGTLELTDAQLEKALEICDTNFITSLISWQLENNKEEFTKTVIGLDTLYGTSSVNTFVPGFDYTWFDMSNLSAILSLPLLTSMGSSLITALTNPVVLAIICVVAFVAVCSFVLNNPTQEGADFVFQMVLAPANSLLYSKMFYAAYEGLTVNGTDYSKYLGNVKEYFLEFGNAIIGGVTTNISSIREFIDNSFIKNIFLTMTDYASINVAEGNMGIIKGNNATEIMEQIRGVVVGKETGTTGITTTQVLSNIETFAKEHPFYPVYILTQGNYFTAYTTYRNALKVPIYTIPNLTMVGSSLRVGIDGGAYTPRTFVTSSYTLTNSSIYTRKFNLSGYTTDTLKESDVKMYVYNPLVSLPFPTADVLDKGVDIGVNTTWEDVYTDVNVKVQDGTITKDFVGDVTAGIENPGLDIPNTGVLDGVFSKVWDFIKWLVIPTVSILDYVSMDNNFIGQILTLDGVGFLNLQQVKPYFEFSVLENKVELPLGDVLEQNGYNGITLIYLIRTITSVLLIISCIVFLKNRFDVQRTQD